MYLCMSVIPASVCLKNAVSSSQKLLTRLARPCGSYAGAGGGQLTTKVVCLLLEWCPWCGWRTCPPGQCEFPGLWKPHLLLSFPSGAGGGCLLC